MKNKKRLLLSLCCAMMISTIPAGLAACKRGGNDDSSSEGASASDVLETFEGGEYYAGGTDEVAYGTHVEVDLSENPALAEVIRENPGEELEVTYIWENTQAEPVTSVIPIDIKVSN